MKLKYLWIFHNVPLTLIACGADYLMLWQKNPIGVARPKAVYTGLRNESVSFLTARFVILMARNLSKS